MGFGVLATWAIYLLVAPTTGFFWLDSWHNEQRAVQLILLSLTAFAFVGLVIVGPEPIRARLTLPRWWLGFIALGVVSAASAQIPLAAFAEVGLFVSLSALVMLTAALTASQPRLMRQAARYGALLIAVAHVLSVMVRYAASLHLDEGVSTSVFMLGYANPRFASALYAVLMPFVAAIAVDRNEKFGLRCLAFAVLCMLWTINLGLGTRGIWFAFLLAIPASLALIRDKLMRYIVSALIASAVLGLLLYVAVTFNSMSDGGSAGAVSISQERLQTLTSREVLWTLSWNAIIEHPLLGLGPMHFARLGSYVGAHPHNWPLQIAAEWGLPALGILLFVLIRAVMHFRSAGRSVSGVNGAAVLSVAAGLGYGLVDGNLVMPVSQTAVAVALGLALGSVSPSPTGATAGVLRTVATCAVISIAAAAVLVPCIESYQDQSRSIVSFRSTHPGEWLVPRLWEQGLLLPKAATGTEP